MNLRKNAIVLLFGLLVNCFVGCSNVNAQVDQVVQTEQVIQDKTSLQNIAYYSVFTLFFITFAIWISKKSKEGRDRIIENISTHIVALMVVGFIVVPGNTGLRNILLFPFLAKTIVFSLAFFYIFLILRYKGKLFFGHSYLFPINLSFWFFILFMFVRFCCFQYGNWQSYSYIERNYAQTALIRIGIFGVLLSVCNACCCLRNKKVFINILQFYCCFLTLICCFLFIFFRDLQFITYTGNNKIFVLLKTSQFSSLYSLGIKLYYLLFSFFILIFWKLKSRQKLNVNLLFCFLICLMLNVIICFYTGKRNVVCGSLFVILCFGIYLSLFLIKNKILQAITLIIVLGISFCLSFPLKKVFINRGGIKMINNRIVLSKPSLNAFKQSKIFGAGVGNYKLGWSHNATMDLLSSGGITAFLLWIFPFCYATFLILKFKCYDELIISPFLFILFLLLQSFFTGFYLYYTFMYIILYCVVFRLKTLNSLVKNA